MRYLLVLIPQLFSGVTFASTWVGNGGNAGDIELRLALNHTRAAVEAVSETRDLCTCPEDLVNSSLCGYVSRLKPDQIEFCSKTVRTLAPELAKLLDSNRVQISWTREDINVQEGGGFRGADAVAEPEHNRITLQQEHFVGMLPGLRIFLLSHEHFHFLKYEGKSLTDEGPIGPFKGEQGSRDLLNSMAAALAMTAVNDGVIIADQPKLQRSRSFMRNYVDLSLASIVYRNDSSPFTENDLSGMTLQYRRNWDNQFGLVLRFTSVSAHGNVLSSIETRETQGLAAVGLSYRYFPVDDPMTRWGQSHFVANALVGNMVSNYSLREPPIDEKTEALNSVLAADVGYMMAFSNGFWGYASLGLNSGGPKYGESKFAGRLDRDGMAMTTNLGVSYGF